MSFKTFAAAVELEVFTTLADGRSVTVDQFAEEMSMAPRAADIFLAALASLELLEKSGAGYRNSALAEEFLVIGRPYYFGYFVRFYNHRLYPGWHRVIDALHTNRPVTWDPDEQDIVFSADDAELMELFWEAMHSLAGYTASALRPRYDFGQHRRLLDVGGGSAGFPIELCRNHPHLTATVYDLPHVCPIAEEKIKSAGLAGVIDTQPGDYETDEALPDGHDVILLSQVLHCGDEPSNRALLAKCWAALPPGGAVMICELLLNPERTGPPAAALMGMNMLLALPGGKNYSETEYLTWLADTGFTDPRIIPLAAAGANGAIVARKAAG